MLAGEMTDYRCISDLVFPRQRKRILRKFSTMGDVQRRGQRGFLSDLVGSEYLSDFQYLGVVGLQIGERDRTVGCAKVDANTETGGHELKVSVHRGGGYSELARLLRENIGSPDQFGHRGIRGRDALCRTPIAPCSLLQFDLRRRNCGQPPGVDPHNARQFHRLRLPAAMDERSRKRPCPADLADETVLIGCITHGHGDR